MPIASRFSLNTRTVSDDLASSTGYCSGNASLLLTSLMSVSSMVGMNRSYASRCLMRLYIRAGLFCGDSFSAWECQTDRQPQRRQEYRSTCYLVFGFMHDLDEPEL